jgi:DNA-binding GntR family transcriptional regulator
MDQRVNISEQAYQHLRSLIIEQVLAPGSVVAERRLAEQLNASRTPLRAAIARLEGEGLVARLSNGSLVIREVSTDELLDILLVRRLLEAEAASIAALKIDDDEVDAMLRETRALVDDPEQEFETFWRYDDRFHELIARGSCKPVLADLIVDLRNKARMCNLARMQKNFQEQAREHLAVLEAIADRDAARARQTMGLHVDEVRKRLVNWLT